MWQQLMQTPSWRYIACANFWTSDCNAKIWSVLGTTPQPHLWLVAQTKEHLHFMQKVFDWSVSQEIEVGFARHAATGVSGPLTSLDLAQAVCWVGGQGFSKPEHSQLQSFLLPPGEPDMPTKKMLFRMLKQLIPKDRSTGQP